MATAKEAPKKATRKITIPRAAANGDPNLYVSVNEYTCLIPRDGKAHEVPDFVAEEIERSLAAKALLEDYVAENSN